MQENYEKNSKRIQKVKKPLSGIIFSQNGMRLAEKEKKKILVPNSVHSRPGHENSVRNRKKRNQNIKKPHSDIIFSQTGMRLAEKESKNSSAEFRSYSDRGRKF